MMERLGAVTYENSLRIGKGKDGGSVAVFQHSTIATQVRQ